MGKLLKEKTRHSSAMQAFEVVYSRDERRVALGWPGGRVVVHAVNESDGSPGEELTEVLRHKATVVLVAWCDDDRLVSVSNDGAWALSDAATGEVQHEGSVGGEYVAASLSPSGASLFLYTYEDDAKAFRVRTADGAQEEGPAVAEPLLISSRVFALDDDVALYHFIRDDYETDETQEGFAYVDFGSGEVEVKCFDAGPSSDFDSETRLMSIDPIRGLGVRPDYAPIELDGDEETGYALVRVELFDVRTLEAKGTRIVIGWPRHALQGTFEALQSAKPGSKEFVDAQDWLVRKLCNARFVRESEHLWFSVSHGVSRRISLADDHRDVVVMHGGGADTGPPSLDDIFARNLMNNITLGVSPSGDYVGFGNPNTFFSVKAIGLAEATTPIELPSRAAAAVESPGCVRFAGDLLAVFDRGNRMFLANGTTGEPTKTVELEKFYGEGSDVSRSPDGEFVVVSVAGGSAFIYSIEQDGLGELPMPPHSIFAQHVDHRFVMTHHSGAVVLFDPEQGMQALRAPCEDGDDPEEDWEAFEQRDVIVGSCLYTIDGSPLVAQLDEDGEIQTYAIGEAAELSVGVAYSARGRRIVGGERWLAIATDTSVTLLNVPEGESIATHEFGRVRALCFAPGDADEPEGFYVYDDTSGKLVRFAARANTTGEAQGDVCFRYSGASVGNVQVAEALDRVALVTATGVIELRRLNGERVAQLEVRPVDRQVRELVRVSV